jgi:hypothetical protein
LKLLLSVLSAPPAMVTESMLLVTLSAVLSA